MSLLELHRFGERRARRAFHICIEVDRIDPALFVTAKPGSLEGFMLVAMSNEEGETLAVVARLPLSTGEGGSILAVTEHVAQDWGSALAVAMNCDKGRIEWVAFDGAGDGFAASHPGGCGPWVALRDLGSSGLSLLEQFLEVFPEMSAVRRRTTESLAGTSGPGSRSARGRILTALLTRAGLVRS